jgi:HEAT repeat protein
MRRGSIHLVWALGALLANAQDEAPPAGPATPARMNELRRDLSSGSEDKKQAAIAELSRLPGEEPIYLLARETVSGSRAMRQRAIQAIAQHQDQLSIRALDNALGENLEYPEVSRTAVEALATLNMCAGIKVLVAALWVERNSLAEDALQALAQIGCPEAASGLVVFLRSAEHEEKKPDELDDGDGGTEENRNKNKTLAGLAPQARKALAAVTGQSFDNASAWSRWLEAQESFQLTTVYLCQKTRRTFELAPGQRKRCPYAGSDFNHQDLLLKHHR